MQDIINYLIYIEQRTLVRINYKLKKYIGALFYFLYFMYIQAN